MRTVRPAINDAITTLALGADQVRELSFAETDSVLKEIESCFLVRQGVLFWWEYLACAYETHNPSTDEGYRLVPSLSPTPHESAWFVADLTGPAKVVYECPPDVVAHLLGECPRFEYAVVAKDYSWLVMENHHGCMFAIGEVPMQRLRELRVP